MSEAPLTEAQVRMIAKEVCEQEINKSIGEIKTVCSQLSTKIDNHSSDVSTKLSHHTDTVRRDTQAVKDYVKDEMIKQADRYGRIDERLKAGNGKFETIDNRLHDHDQKFEKRGEKQQEKDQKQDEKITAILISIAKICGYLAGGGIIGGSIVKWLSP